MSNSTSLVPIITNDSNEVAEHVKEFQPLVTTHNSCNERQSHIEHFFIIVEIVSQEFLKT